MDNSENVQRDEQGHLLPGSRLNPSGRPKGSVSLVTEIQRKLAENPERVDAIVGNLLTLAEDGDHKALHAIRTLLERVDGPVPVKLQGDEDNPVPIKLRFK